LADDFSRGEVSAPSIDAASTEATAVGTADLAGDTKSEAGAAISLLARGGGDED